MKLCLGKIPEAKKACVNVKMEGGTNMKFDVNVNAPQGDGDGDSDEDAQPDPHKMYQLLHLKDRYCISDEAMHKMHMLYPDIPSIHVLKAKRQAANLSLPIDDIQNVGT